MMPKLGLKASERSWINISFKQTDSPGEVARERRQKSIRLFSGVSLTQLQPRREPLLTALRRPGLTSHLPEQDAVMKASFPSFPSAGITGGFCTLPHLVHTGLGFKRTR